MPRKVNSHNNERIDDIPADFADRLVFGEDDVRELLHGIPAAHVGETTEAVREVIGYFMWGREAGSMRYLRSEAMKALDDLVAGEDYGFAALSRLNQRAWNMLYDELSETDGGLFMLGHLPENPVAPADMKAAAIRARAYFATAKGGQERDDVLRETVWKLCHLWEKATGRRVTHSNKQGNLAYSDFPKSEAGRFVHGVLSHFELRSAPSPGDRVTALTPSRISRALRDFVRLRPPDF